MKNYLSRIFGCKQIMLKNSKNAFTLAEVLITLAIIGVVAALTIPVVIEKYQKQETVARLKKSYSVMSQALRLSEADNGPYSDWEVPQFSDSLDLTEYYEKYWYPYFKVLKACKTWQECGYSSSHPILDIGGNKTGHTIVAQERRLAFITTDGILYSISLYGGDNVRADHSIYVDLNAAKGPNKFGRDFFCFTRTASGAIKPSGYNRALDEISKNCSKSGYGDHCAAKIMNDGWQIKDDYPW